MNRSLLVATLCASSFIAGCSKETPPPAHQAAPVEKPKPAAPPPVAAPPVAPSASKWETLDTATFSIDAPGKATVKEGVENTKAGPVKTTTWSVQTEGAFYAVSIADYPKGMMGAAVPGKVLEGARDGAMSNVGGTVGKDVEVSLDAGKKKYPGREFDGNTTQGIKMAARLFLVDDRLYQMISVSPTAAFNADDFKKFADSFKLKATAAAPAKPGKRTKK